LNEQVRATTVAAMERLRVPGVAVGVLRDGAATIEGFGVTSVENPLPVDATTLFQIGSITKTFTATAAMRLVEASQLDLDAPVRAYLPELRLADPEVAARVTLRHALTHVGGWPGDVFDDFGPGDDAIARMVARIAELPQITPLGEVWSYNNVAFCLAGRAIEVVTGRRFEEAIHQLLLAPLGMDRTFYAPAEAITYRCAVGHVSFDDGARVSRPWSIGRSTYPFAGLASCARDLLTWARFQLGDGTAPDGTRLLRPETLAYVRSPLQPAGAMADYVGITWQISDVGGAQVVGHGGSWCNQMSVFRIVPERRFAVVVLTNSHHGAQLHAEVSGAALRHDLGLASPEAPPLDLSPEQLRAYEGVYTAIIDDVRLSPREGGLLLETVRRANVLRTTPDAPLPPPVRLVFPAPDRVVALDPPFKGNRGDFLREPDGTVQWFRWGGRIHRREG
jgi:CubicO group peptidase (beta-lactamase class C family)